MQGSLEFGYFESNKSSESTKLHIMRGKCQFRVNDACYSLDHALYLLIDSERMKIVFKTVI